MVIVIHIIKQYNVNIQYVYLKIDQISDTPFIWADKWCLVFIGQLTLTSNDLRELLPCFGLAPDGYKSLDSYLGFSKEEESFLHLPGL